MRTSVALLFSVLAIIIIYGCGGDYSSLDIRADGWPDGSNVSIISDGSDDISARTNIYGGRAAVSRLSGDMRLRVSHQSIISYLSDMYTVGNVPKEVRLPIPVARRRFGSWHLGISFDHPEADSLIARICDKAPLSFTTLTLSKNNRLVKTAHDAAIECIMSEDGMSAELLAEHAERGGYDGIIIDFNHIIDGNVPFRFNSSWREGLRQRGLTLAVKVMIPAIEGNDVLGKAVEWFNGLQNVDRPDEIRLVFRGDVNVPVVTAERISEMAEYLSGLGIPMSMISVDLTPAAEKFRVTPDGTLEPAEIQSGETAFLFAIVSGTPGVRLRDGSLRIGSRGDFYVVEDAESIARKVAMLRNGPFSASAGIHITCDSKTMLFGPEDLAVIVNAVKMPETVRIY